MSKNPKIVLVGNQKGGVAKSVTAVTLAHGLALQGRRTLLVDLDRQGQCAISLGFERQPGIHSVLIKEQTVESVALPARDNLWLLPGNERTDLVKRYMAAMDTHESEQLLASALAATSYEVVVFDTATGTDALNVSALVASDLLIVPVKLDWLAVDGSIQMVSVAERLNSAGLKVRLGGILPTFYERRTTETIKQLRSLIQQYGRLVWEPIPQDNKARMAPMEGKTLWECAANLPCMIGFEVEDAKGGTKHIGGYRAALTKLMEALK